MTKYDHDASKSSYQLADDETEYDVDGVYTAKDLAEEIMRIVNITHTGYSIPGTGVTVAERYQMLRKAISDHCEEILAG